LETSFPKKIKIIEMRNILSTLIFLISACALFGQQEAHYTHFMYNTLALNPAVAGSKNHPTILALYRKQWIGFDNAPESKLVSFHTPLGSRVGFGLTIENDQLGINNSWKGSMAYAYRVKFSEASTLQVGVQGSIRYLGLDFNDPSVFIIDNNDPSVLDNMVSQKYLGNFGAGLYLNVNQMFFGASVPNFFPNDIGINNLSSSIIAQETPHFYVMGGAVIPISKNGNIALRPSALAKVVQNAPFDLDINMSLIFNKTLITGISYRIGGDGLGDSVDFLLHYRFNTFGVGLAYDYTLSDINDFSNGSIEAIVLYDFVKERVDMANPRFFY